ncbi:MAG: ester cyclase [Nocardioides sp.]|uniref:ester cyclase n=1 Tax=Nocardioides sp. TaxID=35761 RepID=UPI0039E547BC
MSDATRLVADYHRRLWAEGDLGAIGEAFAPDAIVHLTGFDDRAVAAVRADAVRYRGAFTEVSTEILTLLTDGDRVVLHWSTVGRHVGPYGKVPATGRVVTMTGIDIFRIADGRVIECWSLWDGLDVYDQLGVLPELW